MIIPSIDIMGGDAVQLIGGETLEINAGDPRKKLEEFRIAGEVAVIDLDAAMNQGSNAEVIEEMIRLGACRVGGGIRDLDTAISWLDKGASKIILGTKAVPEILRELPRERIQAALDAENGEVVVEGWKEKTGRGIIERMLELRDYVGGFLVTFVEKEGRMQGTNLELVEELVKAAGNCSLTIAGGVTTEKDLKTLDALGVDAQVGMALYSGKLHFADSIISVLETNESCSWPTIICDEQGKAKNFAWSNKTTLRELIENKSLSYLLEQNSKKSVYVNEKILSVTPDFERKTLRITTEDNCDRTAWGHIKGLVKLEKLIQERLTNAPDGSYTKRLFSEKKLLDGKIIEEANELIEAQQKKEIIWEAADLMYFTMCKLGKNNIKMTEIEDELDFRSLKILRRPGNLK